MMEKGMYNSYLEIDVAALRQNISGILATLPEGVKLIPMLKCNAYGLGMEQVAGVAREFPAIDMFALAQVSEALALRCCGITHELLVTGACATPAQMRAALEQDITLAAYSLPFLTALVREAQNAGKTANIHIKINTGLNRLGFTPGEELAEAITLLKKSEDCIRVTGSFSHFTEMEAPETAATTAQYNLFLSALEQLKASGIDPGLRHICASAGYEFHPEMALDAVRLGRRLYYDNPVRPIGGIQDTASWRAIITDVQERRAGDRLGYGEGYALDRDSRIAMLGVGYGDGLFHALVNCGAPVLVCGQEAKLLCCCMDQCFVDVTGIDCHPGDEATLFGYDEQGNLLPGQQVAALMSDEGCTLTAALGPRVARIYT